MVQCVATRIFFGNLTLMQLLYYYYYYYYYLSCELYSLLTEAHE